MKVLVVGSGAREHALVWKIRRSPLVKDLYCAPGGPGMARLCDRLPIDPSAIVELADFAEKIKIDLAVVGPELPLTLGIADEFQKRGLAIFGATQAAAALESSKAFAKEFMKRHKIPTAKHETVGSAEEARKHLKKRKDYPVVLKADGLAGGKGVVVAGDRKEADAAVESMMVEKRFGVAGERLVIEEFLEGTEASFFALSDGERILPLVTCQDYKRLGDGDTGPNTGGMGGYSPSIHVDAETFRAVLDGILVPTIAGMVEEGRPYRGVLYVGLMLTRKGPKVLEYNARFGDPEAELICVRMKSDLVPLLQATLAGQLEDVKIEWLKARAACVVLAASGYPGEPVKDTPISGIEKVEAMEGVEVFHAGTAVKDGAYVTAGGRVLTIAAIGGTFAEATERCYAAARTITFEGKQFRTDIAADALETLARTS